MDDLKEFDTVILIVDLSGYTALTEAHGNKSAAEIVTRYIEIVHCSLLEDVKLVERVGDEVLILSSDAENILGTAIKIRDIIEQEPFFPNIHAGIHAGSIVEKDGHYFGTTLNLASRVAAYARGGQILCTQKICDLVGNLKDIKFRALGGVKFKNIVEPVAIFEVLSDQQKDNQLLLDPVCKMLVNSDTAPARLPYRDKIYYFCSFDCAKAFTNNPKHYFEI